MPERDPRPELRLFLLKECVINRRPQPAVETADFAWVTASLSAIFIPKLIEMAIGGFATLLKKLGSDKVQQADAQELTDFYVANDKQVLHTNPALKCILGVYGIFSDKDGKATDPNDKALIALENALIVPKNADIRIIFEAEIVQSPDRTAFFLDGRHFSVRGFIGKDGGRDERGFVVTLAVATAGATIDGETFAIGNIDFGTVERGANVVPPDRPTKEYPRFWSNLMPWGQISGASEAAYKADLAAGKAADRRYMPVTVTLTFSQTEKGFPLLLKLSELLEATKAGAAAEIARLVSPEERAKAAAEKVEAAEQLYQNELTAQVEEIEAKKALNANPGEEVLILKHRMALRKLTHARALRVAAGLPDPPK